MLKANIKKNTGNECFIQFVERREVKQRCRPAPYLHPYALSREKTLYNHLYSRHSGMKTSTTTNQPTNQPTRCQPHQITNQPDKHAVLGGERTNSISAPYLAARSSPRNISTLWTSFFFSGMCCLLSPEFSELNLSFISWIHKFSFLCWSSKLKKRKTP